MQENHYARLGAMTTLSFIAMYALMYAMVDSFASVYNNLNQAYMAGLMAAPMVPIELALMRGMYQDGRRNALFLAGRSFSRSGVSRRSGSRPRSATGSSSGR